ncbi:MAG: hypothetical protein NWE93_03050 [Candidatus Bathyarchaeota archaeon]|nr:hypothetical protein [Candidatus Bathyarchaeota archaeon]
MSTLTEFIKVIHGVCGGETELVVILREDTKDLATSTILARCTLKRSFSNYMFELEFESVTFRLFVSGRVIFRGVKDRAELDRILSGLLL